MQALHQHVRQLDIQGTPQAWISIEHAATHHTAGAVARANLFDAVPAVARDKLFRRDRMTCAYCGQRFAERDLQCEHVLLAGRHIRADGHDWLAARLPKASRLS